MKRPSKIVSLSKFHTINMKFQNWQHPTYVFMSVALAQMCVGGSLEVLSLGHQRAPLTNEGVSDLFWAIVTLKPAPQK